MQSPPYLKEGDVVRIISTARKISKEEIESAKSVLESWGLLVSLGENLYEEQHQFAGDKEKRKADLQAALNDTQVKAIICARGGYGTVQLIDQINFQQYVKQPKWIVGYSDITVLHNHINQNFNIQTLHATMPVNFPKNGKEDQATESLKKALFGKKLAYEFEIEKGSILPQKTINAQLVGGNLSIIYSLTGTISQIDTENKWFFIEDLDEYLYHIDRMMMNLKRAGLLNKCKGLLVGGMNKMNDNAVPYGQTAKEIIIENMKEFDIPIIFGVPAGHIKNNFSMYMGRELKLSIQKNKVKLEFLG